MVVAARILTLPCLLCLSTGLNLLLLSLASGAFLFMEICVYLKEQGTILRVSLPFHQKAQP
ncbi:hypothetical protein M440DRAFT_1400607 [Trichoderma longibrachiatum ATCC 18648]|uniref:Uncharacterized protein n=1 Tax=Trichoderma longibrachiatum ATCC 18648 TaxID=983965 RepID=A0A2T4C7W0_TRILO|nr:hypothetical protein M440DRAFT_1400607 [Trichoderma longibrachiatum ATCC 18648]